MIAAVVLAFAPIASVPPEQGCTVPDKSAVVVCGQNPRPYRMDPDVTAGARQARRDGDAASPAMPAAQAACAQSPMGCGKGLDGLDLANVALVAGTMAVKAATGKNWSAPLQHGGPGEYQRYREAKQAREERAADRAARELRDAARGAADRP